MTQIYNYDRTTGEYFSTTTAKADPIGGVDRIPAHATTTPPPSLSANEVACWGGSSWVAKADFRGTSYWTSGGANAQPVAITEIGVTAPEGSHSSKPLATDAELAADLRARRDGLLAASDSMALVDRITDAWRTYRKKLRDVPAQAGFPNSVTWPTEPD